MSRGKVWRHGNVYVRDDLCYGKEKRVLRLRISRKFSVESPPEETLQGTSRERGVEHQLGGKLTPFEVCVKTLINGMTTLKENMF